MIKLEKNQKFDTQSCIFNISIVGRIKKIYNEVKNKQKMLFFYGQSHSKIPKFEMRP
jgi:hypothetical protein